MQEAAEGSQLKNCDMHSQLCFTKVEEKQEEFSSKLSVNYSLFYVHVFFVLIYTWVEKFVDWMGNMTELGVLHAPCGISSAPLKYQSPPSMYLSYFTSWDLTHMDISPTHPLLSASKN